MSTKAYSKLENGQTTLTLHHLHHIARVLGMTPSDIIAFSEENIIRSCPQCVYQQLSGLADATWLTERLALQQRIKALEARLAERYQSW